MSVDPHEGEASDASRSTKGLCPFDAERELRGEPPTAGTREEVRASTIVGDPQHPAETWDPEPASLRDGETRDDSAHATANREMIRRAKIEGVTEADRDE